MLGLGIFGKWIGRGEGKLDVVLDLVGDFGVRWFFRMGWVGEVMWWWRRL